MCKLRKCPKHESVWQSVMHLGWHLEGLYNQEIRHIGASLSFFKKGETIGNDMPASRITAVPATLTNKDLQDKTVLKNRMIYCTHIDTERMHLKIAKRTVVRRNSFF